MLLVIHPHLVKNVKSIIQPMFNQGFYLIEICAKNGQSVREVLTIALKFRNFPLIEIWHYAVTRGYWSYIPHLPKNVFNPPMANFTTRQRDAHILLVCHFFFHALFM